MTKKEKVEQEYKKIFKEKLEGLIKENNKTIVSNEDILDTMFNLINLHNVLDRNIFKKRFDLRQ